MMKWQKCLFIGLCFAPTLGIAGGSLNGTDTCPVPSITGHTETLTFDLQGPTPPSNAEVTVVNGQCSVNGDFPSIAYLTAGGISVNVSSLYRSESFEGISPNSTFILTMRYSGDYGYPTNSTGGTCILNVSWEIAVPPSTPITGPDTVKVRQTIELDGEADNATLYSWQTTTNCAIDGQSDQSTVTIKGISEGSCEVSREACNSQDECVTNTHSITVLHSDSFLISVFKILML